MNSAEIIIIPTSISLPMLKEMAQTLAQELVEQGFTVHEEISVCPDRTRLQQAISKALERSDMLFTIGGMGRESRFLAKQVMSEGLGLPLTHSQKTMDAIQLFAIRSGLSLSPDDATLASLPAGSTELLPEHGILPGCVISSSEQHIIMLPENVTELDPMLQKQVFPLLARYGISCDVVHTVRTYGITEEQARKMISDLMGTTNPVVTTYIEQEEVVVRVAAKGKNMQEAAKICTTVLRTIVTRLGDYAYGLDVENLAEATMQKLQKKEQTVSIAEAGVNSMVSTILMTIPDSLPYIKRATAAEDNEIKIKQFGIRPKDLKKRGDVSEFVAVQMANAVRILGDSTLGLGICADIPGSSQQEDAVAFIAVCDEDNVYVKKIIIAAEDILSYDAVVAAIVARGLNMLRLVLDYLPTPYPASVPLEPLLSGKTTVTDKETYDDSEVLFDSEIFENPPVNKRKRKNKGTVIVLLLALAVFVGAAAYLGQYALKSILAGTLRDNLSEVYAQTGMVGLKSLNSDTVGFVAIPETELQYPVVQAADNNVYLRRNFNKKNDPHGVPFLDYRANAKKPSKNLVIYGHNMRDGQMFAELLKYKDVEYYKQHPVIEYEGQQKKAEYKIFAVFLSSAETTHYNDGKIFNYPNFVDTKDKKEYEEFIKQVRVRSIMNYPVDVKPGDELITLSTCDYDLMNFRFVVMARKVRVGESASVETAKVEINPTPLYPDAWYQNYGGVKPNVDDWDYTPPSAPEKQEESSSKPASSSRESSKPRKESSREVSQESSESSESRSIESSQSRADESSVSSEPVRNSAAEEASRQEAERLAEQSRQAELEASRAAAAEQSRREEEARIAAQEKERKEAEAKAAAEQKKKDAEKNALAALNKAKIAAEEAASFQREALNAKNKAAAEEAATKAEAAAARAKDAATNAREAADIAKTVAAIDAANGASTHASEAELSAQTARETAKIKGTEDEWDLPDGNAPLKINTNANYDPANTLDIISRIVQNEVGSSFHPEAIKAQAVAAYTFIRQANANGSTPSVSLAPKADDKVTGLVRQVLGQAVYYGGDYAFTPYHATSAGSTTSSRAVWGGNYPYLIAVDSSVDQNASGYKSTVTMSADKVSGLISQKLGITVSGSPERWFEVRSEEDGGYNGQMAICGNTKNALSGSPITGRMLRENVLGLRSASFDITYQASTNSFIFTTYGYGHGVGMSQTGANQYAQQGWSYQDILQHYYPGTTIQ